VTPEPGPIQFERLVRAYLSERRHMEAMVVAKKAIGSLDRFFHPKFYALLAETYLDAGNTSQATNAVRAALEIDPAFAPALEIQRRLDA
jgi:hypothetical protein